MIAMRVASMNQLELFAIEDDRPERGLSFLYNPNAPATEEDIAEFFQTMRNLLDQPERRAT